MPRAQNRTVKCSIFKEDEIHFQSGYVIRLKTSRLPAISFLALLILWATYKCKEYNLGWEVTVIECIVYICAGHPFPPVILSSQPVPPQVQRVQPGLGGDCHWAHCVHLCRSSASPGDPQPQPVPQAQPGRRNDCHWVHCVHLCRAPSSPGDPEPKPVPQVQRVQPGLGSNQHTHHHWVQAPLQT